jgi:hypothetical protein
MGNVLKAYLNLIGTEPAGMPVARDAYEKANVLPANDRERRHQQAIAWLIEGRWRQAGSVLEDLSIDYPHDALALQVGHLIDFFTGDSRMLRDRIARALPAWDAGIPGYHALLGMHAFGLEETGGYARAESEGRMSVELSRATAGASTHLLTSWKCRGGGETALPGCAPRAIPRQVIDLSISRRMSRCFWMPSA